MAYPTQVRELSAAQTTVPGNSPLRLHFHNTRGMGLANVFAALEVGVDRFDASVGGLGGSPYASGVTGNISTEDLIHMLHEMGRKTGIDLEALIGCAKMLEELLDHELLGQVMKAGICGHLTQGLGTIKSLVSPDSPDFEANAEAFEGLMEGLRDRVYEAQRAGGKKAHLDTFPNALLESWLQAGKAEEG